MTCVTNFHLNAVLALSLAVSALAGPCDIYASGGTPCVAAHATTRSLYNSYKGPLYQVQRNSDSSTTNINALSPGGTANSALQDYFCANTTCVISIIYDQSGHGNHLTQAPPGGAATGPNPGGYDDLASATGAPVLLNGKKAYGVFIHPSSGYRNNQANGTATGDAPEGLYNVVDGTHYNSACCFDYGNAETSSHDTGNGHMESIYFGSETGYQTGAGSGPWILADLENGLFADNTGGVGNNDPTITNRFVTAVVKGKAGQWAIRGGNAASGGLATYFSGPRPANGYNPMHKEGAIILGTGGDNSDGSQGTFYEGVMTTGYPSDATENSVQANVVAAKYATTSLVSGPAFVVGSSISFQATTACCTADYLTHSGSAVSLQPVTANSNSTLKQQATWVVRTGLAQAGCYSFESVDTPGSFLRHSSFQLQANANDGSKLFSEDATYCPQAGFTTGNSIRSYSFPTRYFRHYNYNVYIASNGGPEDFDSQYSFVNDASWNVGKGFA